MIHQSGFRLTRRIVEFRIKPNPAFAVGTGERVLAPARCREDNIRIAGTDRVDQIDVLVPTQPYRRSRRGLFQRVDDVLLVK